MPASGTARAQTAAAVRARKLVRKAVRQRESRRSGRSRVMGILSLAAIIAVGLVMIIAVYGGHSSAAPALIFGLIVLTIAGAAVAPVLRNLDPARPWGTARAENCPACGQPSLREKEMYRVEYYGNVTATSRGVVTLCTADCGFTSIRKP